MKPLSIPRKVNVGALCAAAAGILILFVSVPDEFPSVPPGPIILLITAGLVSFAPGRWTPLVGVIAPLFIFIGGFVASATPDLLFSPDNVGAFAGVLVEMIALLTAIAYGIIALRADQPRAPKVA